jgi:hypothetical protein
VERGAPAEQPGEGARQEPDEARVATIVSTAPSPPDDPPVAAATDQSAADAAPAAASISTDPAATKIATLGGPPVDIETLIEASETLSKAKADAAKPDESAKKREEAKRAARHRRIAAARARLAAQQAQQLQAGPFFQQPRPTVRAR